MPWDVTPVVSGVPRGWRDKRHQPMFLRDCHPPDHLNPDQTTLGAGTGVDRAMAAIEED